LIVWGTTDYPELLRDIPDPPAALWALGDLTLLNRLCGAVVGAREASGLAVRMTRKIAQDLGEAGLVVVSGLARGVDAAAHEGALATGTIAVQPGGIDVLYPEETANLARSIAANGLRLAEQPPGFAPRAQSFLARNRIISGLSRAIVVTEAAARSGALNAARAASDQGREVMAVPGHPYEPRASGCNHLIRDGATLIRSARDILETMAGAGIALYPVGQVTAPPIRNAVKPAQASFSKAGQDLSSPSETLPSFKIPSPPDPVGPQIVSPATHPAAPSSVGFDEDECVDWILARLETSGAGIEILEEEILRDCPAPATIALRAISVLELEGMIARGVGGRLALL
jgi:DNA protecting protein DprA